MELIRTFWKSERNSEQSKIPPLKNPVSACLVRFYPVLMFDQNRPRYRLEFFFEIYKLWYLFLAHFKVVVCCMLPAKGILMPVWLCDESCLLKDGT